MCDPLFKDSVWIVHLKRRGLKWDGKEGSARKVFLENYGAAILSDYKFIPAGCEPAEPIFPECKIVVAA